MTEQVPCEDCGKPLDSMGVHAITCEQRPSKDQLRIAELEAECNRWADLSNQRDDREHRLRIALRGISTCSTCEACRGAATLALGIGADIPPDGAPSMSAPKPAYSCGCKGHPTNCYRHPHDCGCTAAEPAAESVVVFDSGIGAAVITKEQIGEAARKNRAAQPPGDVS